MSNYKNVSFATFEEDDSYAANGYYGFEQPIDGNGLDGRLWVGYDFNRESARLYIDLKNGDVIERLPFYPNYSYAILDPITEDPIYRGDGLRLVYFSEGVPVESDENRGGPANNGVDCTPVYLSNGAIVACAGTTVTTSDQSFNGVKTFQNNVIVNGTAQFNSALTIEGVANLNSELNVSGATALSSTLDVSNVATFAKKIVLSGTEATTSQISFARTDNPSYFLAASGGYFCFTTNDKGTGTGNADLIIKNNQVYPGTTNVCSLGTSDKKWSNVYATTFTGALSGNASSASKLSTNENKGNVGLPIYFSAGVAEECVPANLFTEFSRSARDTTKNTLKATICGQTRTLNIAAADATYAGLLTAADQTIAGIKTFNNNVVIKGQASLLDKIIIDSKSYGTELPSSGVEGQVFFVLIE